MALRLGQAFGNGIRRVLTRSGGVLFVALLAIQFLIQATANTLVLGFLPEGAPAEATQMLGLTLPVSGTVAAVLFLLVMVLSSAYFVAMARGLARPMRELGSFPSSLYTRRVGRATLSLIGGGILVGIAVSIGLAFLILPGIYLGACFLFFAFEVSIEDERAIAAIKRSWTHSKGNRLKLAVIVLLGGVIGAVVGAVGSVIDLVGSPVASEVIVNVLSTVLFIALYGIMADAYVQVLDGDGGGLGGTGTANPVDGGVATDRP
ncbi:hypothetical protein [Halobellus rubicundus]|uniref:DUF7847 domain-containing protein n=1 Tax=Halobellus rubicundus TaxID=2996466 RepID=A0ABD5MAT3_9EURY